MSDHVYWFLETNIREGRLAELKTLMKEMVDATKANEPGTLNYEWTISEDSKRCALYERYLDSAAAMTHLGAFMKNYAGRFMECLEVKKWSFHGKPSDELKNVLAGQGAVIMQPFGGFAR